MPDDFLLDAANDLACRQLALGKRLQIDEETTGIRRLVGAVDADEGAQAFDVGIPEDCLGKLVLQFGHRLVGDALRGFGNSLDHPGILHREEALRDQDVQADRDRERQHSNCQRQRLPVQHPTQRPAVELDDGVEGALGMKVEARAFDVRTMANQLGAHHRHERQRDDGRNDDGDRERYGKFVEQAANDVAHEQQRNKHGDQRNGQRDDREPDLPRAAQRRFEGVHAAFDMARNVFDHHDGVVDDEAGRDGERHERQIVQAEAEQVHRSQRSDQGERHGEARNDRSRYGAQEHEDHNDDEHDRERQVEFHVGDRGADGDGAIAEHADVDSTRQRGYGCAAATPRYG